MKRFHRFIHFPAGRSGVIAALAVAFLADLIAVPDAGAASLRVFAAASLTEAFQDIGAAFHAKNPGVDVEFNFAGSQVLRLQIVQGADADLFASADHVQMDSLKLGGLVSPDSVFARNRLVAVTPKEGSRVRSLADLARPGLRIVIADATVPVGRYTATLLANMNRAGLYGDDYQRRVTANVVSQEANVRAVLTKVSLGEADAGFVYATDARTAADKVVSITIPDRVNVIAEYPIAVVSQSRSKDDAARFMAFVLGAEAQSTLAARGFQPAR